MTDGKVGFGLELRVFRYQRPNSQMYNFVEVSEHNLLFLFRFLKP